MFELDKKYQVGVRKFGLVNWIGFYTLYVKEVNRFLVVWAQTLLSPLISSLLFLSVLSLAIGNERGEVLGFSFISFLAPGLIAMSIIQQGFSHSSSSLMIGKIQGNIIDTLLAPLSALEVTLGIILAAVTRSIIITIISIIVFSLVNLAANKSSASKNSIDFTSLVPSLLLSKSRNSELPSRFIFEIPLECAMKEVVELYDSKSLKIIPSGKVNCVHFLSEEL